MVYFNQAAEDPDALLDQAAYDEVATPDHEMPPALGAAVEGGARYVGREGLWQYFRTLSATLEAFRAVGDDYRDLGDRVLWLGRVEGRGRGSGVPAEALSGTLAHFRDGRIFRTRGFLDHGEALRAAGLSD